MDKLGCKRYCCRRMIMTHVDLIEKLLKYVSQILAVFGTRLTACQIQSRRERQDETLVTGNG